MKIQTDVAWLNKRVSSDIWTVIVALYWLLPSYFCCCL